MKYLLPLLIALSALTAPLAQAEDGSKRFSDMLEQQHGKLQQDLSTPHKQ
ncbi:hypothetical protein [Pseudomonas abyssi]